MVSEVGLASAITRLRALEKATYDAGPWTMTLCGAKTPARRLVTENGVSFLAEFPGMDLFGRSHALTLLCRDDMVLSRDFTAPDYGTFTVDWSLNLDSMAAAA